MRKTTIFLFVMLCSTLLMAEDRWLMVNGEKESGTDFGLVATESPVLSKGTLFFTASWCPPCQRVKKESFAILRASGWKIGDETSGHVQVIDVDEYPALKERFEVNGLPTWIKVMDGAVVDRKEGFMDGRTAGFWMRGESAPVSAAQKQQTQLVMPVRQRSFLFWSWYE